MDMDDALRVLDSGGRQQWKHLLATTAQSLPGIVVVLLMEFIGYTPNFECHRQGPNGTDILVNACFNDTTAFCDDIVFRSEYTSVATEWSLVCERTTDVHLLQSLFMAGMTIGAPLVSPLADMFGRRRVVLLTFGLQALLVAALVVVPNYATFAVLRFLAGVLHMGGMSCFTLSSELVGPQYRSRVGLFSSIFSSIGIQVLALGAYVTTTWRLLVIASAAMAGLSVFVIWL
ncbi:solute carrier family 22 member 15-like [Pollicipes pollicipes]|uniref:solute carrier family 22 member 15-like n=1 Tax=Pollicipes pollicipes TaxID=41117 RepID=UPI0018850267|nr:solute carrier family 22 member 15-like [Pollicipes pollicipes]